MSEERLMNKNVRKYGATVICLLVILLLSACAASGGSSDGASESNGNVAGGTAVSQATSEQAAEAGAGELTSAGSDVKYDIEEINIDYGNGSIYGRLYAPVDPSGTLVVLSHGFGGSYSFPCSS